MSSVSAYGIELGVRLGRGVEDGEELAQAGGQGDLLELACGQNSLTEGADGGVVACGGEPVSVAVSRGTPQLEAPAGAASFAAVLAGVLGVRRHADRRGVLAQSTQRRAQRPKRYPAAWTGPAVSSASGRYRAGQA